MNDIVSKVYKAFEEEKEIDNAIEVLAVRFGVTQAKINNAIRNLCILGVIEPSHYYNTGIPEEMQDGID